MTLNVDQIKAAIQAGNTVFWKSPEYNVIRDSAGQWLICHPDSVIGLTWSDGITLNGNPEDFHILNLS